MKLLHTAVGLAVISLVTACGGGGSSSGGGSGSSSSSSSGGNVTVDLGAELENVQSLLNTNADIAYAAYSDAVDTAVDLQTAIATFKEETTQPNLDAAKKAWLVAREPYGQTEVYRFRLSPIDSTDYQSEDGPEGDINAWPLGEALIDYVQTGTDFGDDQVGVTAHNTGIDYPTENIINSEVEINTALISNTATADDEHDVISGYHAIEFMLWGQDLNDDGASGNPNTIDSREQSTTGDILNSGGHRPLSDFTEELGARRLQYLEVVVAKLVEDLTSVRDGWAPEAEYRTAFTTVENEAQALQKLTEILTGMGTLSEGELAGERMQIAFSSNSQEDEHSCFSDNTHRDIWLDAEGVMNSYYGVYAGYDSDLDGIDDALDRSVSGYGFDDLLDAVGLDLLANEIEDALATTETGYTAIDNSARGGVPVDNLIMDANRDSDNPMYTTIIALNAQSSLIAQLAEALGIDDDVVDDGASDCNTSDPDSSC